MERANDCVPETKLVSSMGRRATAFIYWALLAWSKERSGHPGVRRSASHAELLQASKFLGLLGWLSGASLPAAVIQAA